jgi:hypothetical protein
VIRVVCFVLVLAFGVASASADEYWVAYEGNDFPENEGWTRTTYGGGAERSLEDGMLVLDGRADDSIVDSYSMRRPIDPGLGELFIMRLRLRVDEIASGPWDPAFAATSDESWRAGFILSETRVENLDIPGMSASFDPGVFHTFELRSWDMRSFELRIDGSLALAGPFTHIITASKVSWGDQIVGGASLSRWDYFEFGVIPEPGSASLFALGLFLGRSLS